MYVQTSLSLVATLQLDSVQYSPSQLCHTDVHHWREIIQILFLYLWKQHINQKIICLEASPDNAYPPL